MPTDREVKFRAEHCRAPFISQHFRVVELLQLQWFRDGSQQPAACCLLLQLCGWSNRRYSCSTYLASVLQQAEVFSAPLKCAAVRSQGRTCITCIGHSIESICKSAFSWCLVHFRIFWLCVGPQNLSLSAVGCPQPYTWSTASPQFHAACSVHSAVSTACGLLSLLLAGGCQPGATNPLTTGVWYFHGASCSIPVPLCGRGHAEESYVPALPGHVLCATPGQARWRWEKNGCWRRCCLSHGRIFCGACQVIA